MQLKPDFNHKTTLEKYSSTASLSDMEIFVFPDLLFPLVISNIMSPIIWKWRDDPWFKDIQKKSFTYKINRIKQYIMDHYVFNLDLETWGLTTKEAEINRFKDFIDMDILKQSNALFGYEGDKYYFDMDIRKHFGLDKYTTDIIPYWKTETVEAMTAFSKKEGFASGAGECVSFSALYAAAMFVVGRIPLEKIFLIGTPLHSQNFVNEKEGLLTNNRRIVTKKMWYNGTALSTKARRALENEKITIVAHLSGYIHYIYKNATIDIASYQGFSDNISKFLKTELMPYIFINFLRFHEVFKKCFQYRHSINGRNYYIGMEKIFEYEHSNKLNFSDTSRDVFMKEIDDEEFQCCALEHRLVIQDVEDYLNSHTSLSVEDVKDYFVMQAKSNNCNNVENISLLFKDLQAFLHVVPQLPEKTKKLIKQDVLPINENQSREEIIELITKYSSTNETALMTLYTYRQMDKIDWKPFVIAALQRNPAVVEGLKGQSVDEVYKTLNSYNTESIYDGKRLAQPDEVYNFQSGDGIEKALALANYIVNITNVDVLLVNIENELVVLNFNGTKYKFASNKGLMNQMDLKEMIISPNQVLEKILM